MLKNKKPKFRFASHIPTNVRIDENGRRVFGRFVEFHSELQLKRSALIRPHTANRNFKRLSISKLEFNENKLLIAEFKDKSYTVVGYIATYQNFKLKFPVFEAA